MQALERCGKPGKHMNDCASGVIITWTPKVGKIIAQNP